jgi:hypothetical protein
VGCGGGGGEREREGLKVAVTFLQAIRSDSSSSSAETLNKFSGRGMLVINHIGLLSCTLSKHNITLKQQLLSCGSIHSTTDYWIQ